MEEAGLCGLRRKADMLCNSESHDILQHQDSNCSATSNKHLLEDEEGSDFITKNRSWVSPVHCTQESRKELPEQEVAPPSGQQALQCNRNKEKVLGNNLCSVVGCCHILVFLFYIFCSMSDYELGLFGGKCCLVNLFLHLV